MNLSFKNYFPDKSQTWFIDKIWLGLIQNEISDPITASQYFTQLYEKTGLSIIKLKENILPKITSIREDKTDRWKPNNKIHFIINNRTKNRFQFAPVILCKSVQKIQILYNYNNTITIYIDNHIHSHYDIEKEINWNRPYSQYNLNTIIQNDGFETLKDFFKWFNKDFEGKIIHWTDIKY